MILTTSFHYTNQLSTEIPNTTYNTEKHGETYDFVTRAVVKEDNHLYIGVRGNFLSTHGCAKPWTAKSKYPITDERTKALLSIALASLLSKKPVHVISEGCTETDRLIFTSIQIQYER